MAMHPDEWTEEMQAVVGARLRRVRIQQNLSIRRVAELADMSKTTVVLIESGRTSRRASYVRLASLLGLHVEHMLTVGGSGGEQFAVHRRQNDQWFDLSSFDQGPLPDSVQDDPSARTSYAKEHKLAPLNILASRLDLGRIKPTVLEVFEPTPLRSHQGEEHVYVLEGQAVVTVSGSSIELESGESITFWSAEPHSYGPKEGSPLPVRLLSVRVDV